jgi:probable F420-dependent oxidoreductase
VGVVRKEFGLRLGVSLPSMGSHPDPQRLASVAQEAERLAFDSVWVPDHVLRVFGPILDPLTVLSFVAGATRRIVLGTNVLIVPYRHPVILANEAASLDVLSGGRFVLGVGVGWNEEEFSALGMSVRERGRRTDEALEAMKQLWAGGPATYEGRHYSFTDATLGTSPQTEGGPPILVGGYSDAALRRALHFGEKWGGFMDSPERIREVRERLERLSEGEGRYSRELEVLTTFRIEVPSREPADSAERVASELVRLGEAGVDLCVLAISPTRSETLCWVAEEVAPRLR